MLLKSVKYVEYEGTSQEWSLDGLSLGMRNLIVGKNASGKSRILNIISSLAKLLAGLKTPSLTGKYTFEFIDNSKILTYLLHFEDEKVIEEQFIVKNSALLTRSKGGEGLIWADEIDNGKMIRFQTPPSELASVARRDSIQHKFLEPLYDWGASLRHYYFGSSLGKDHLVLFDEKKSNKVDERDPNAVIALYNLACKDFGSEFKKVVMNDMITLDYAVEEIGVKSPISIRVVTNVPGELVCLYVKEKDLPCITDQHSMSQGMFRALSILIQVNYSHMAKKATCILIDDIGEGLDFDRSCKLINLLRKKSQESSIQLILSTNDRFVMNNVPLEEWSVIQRQGGHVQVRNYKNSRDVFDEFKYTGLSNFSFLELDFMNETRVEEKTAHE